MRLFLILLTSFLFACAPITRDNLRSNPEGVYKYIVHTDYKTTYSRIIKHGRACAETDAIRFNGDLYEDINKAEIAYDMLYNGVNTLIIIDIEMLDQNSTGVSVAYQYSVNNAWKDLAGDIRQWANDNPNICTHKINANNSLL